MLEPSSSNDFWRLRIACAVLFGIPLLIAALVRLSTLLEWFNAAYNWDARLGVRQLDYENIPSSNSNIIPLDHLDNIDYGLQQLEERMSLHSPRRESLQQPLQPLTPLPPLANNAYN